MTDDLAKYDISLDLINSSDPISAVVGVHLHIEAFLIALIVRRLAKPKALDLDRLSFPSKLGLAVALGAVPEIAAPALRTISTLRNRIAHNLGDTLTADDGERLRAQISFMKSAAVFSKWDAVAPSQRISLCAMALQAWLNGVVASEQFSHANPGADLEAEAALRYSSPSVSP